MVYYASGNCVVYSCAASMDEVISIFDGKRSLMGMGYEYVYLNLTPEAQPPGYLIERFVEKNRNRFSFDATKTLDYFGSRLLNILNNKLQAT